MILSVLLGLLTFIVALLSFSPVVTTMCTAPFLLILLFGLSRGGSDVQMGLAALGAFLPVAAWMAWAIYTLNYMPQNASTQATAMAMGIAFFVLPFVALASALFGAKLGGKWDRRHEGGSEGGLSFLRDRSEEGNLTD